MLLCEKAGEKTSPRNQRQAYINQSPGLLEKVLFYLQQKLLFPFWGGGNLRRVDYQAIPLPLDVIFRRLFSDIQAIKLQLPGDFFFSLEYDQRDLGAGRHCTQSRLSNDSILSHAYLTNGPSNVRAAISLQRDSQGASESLDLVGPRLNKPSLTPLAHIPPSPELI